MSFLYRDNLDRYVSEVRNAAERIPYMTDKQLESIIFGLSTLIVDKKLRRWDDGICYSVSCLIDDRSLPIDFTYDCVSSWRLFDPDSRIIPATWAATDASCNSKVFPIRTELTHFRNLYSNDSISTIVNKVDYWNGAVGFFREDLLAHCYDIAMAESIYRANGYSVIAQPTADK